MIKKPKVKFPSELRFDLVSRDWVVIATGRGKRPEVFKKEKRRKIKIPKKICSFCNIETQETPELICSQGKKIPFGKSGKIPKNWTIIVIPNKFPPLLPSQKLEKKTEGKFYQTMNAVGFCELVVTKDHQKHFPHFEISQVKEVFDVYQERYLDLMRKPFVNYVSIFHNHGAEAGASQPHPHSQIITTPLIDVDLQKALSASEKYFKKNKKCIYCQMNNWERKMKKRVVFENKDFLAICPFASKAAFEVIVSPKRHLPYFERITEDKKWQLAEAFRKVMIALYKGLSDPAYNFYLHTAPCDGKDHSHYHWHWTILPKTAIPAGFEIGTRMEISTIEPEKAAAYLKKM
ncbi:MAG: galactose-1-phosphate uridylyltransferase [Candidatus Paceibacterales bacterium]